MDLQYCQQRSDAKSLSVYNPNYKKTYIQEKKGNKYFKRSKVKCTVCGKLFKSNHFKSHLRTHKALTTTEINQMCSLAYASKGVLGQCKFCLNFLSCMLGRCANIEEVLDTDLILKRDIETRNIKDSSKGTYCSYMITVCDAVIWNMKTYPNSPRSQLFQNLSISDLENTRDIFNRAKNNFHVPGQLLDRKMEKEVRMPSSQDISEIYKHCKRVIDEILNSISCEEKTFKKLRDYTIVFLITFFPIRLRPIRNISVQDVKKPFYENDDTIILKVNDSNHKTYQSQGAPILKMSLEFFEVLKKYVERLETFMSITETTKLFCSWKGDPLHISGIGNIVSDITFKILNKRINATALRAAKITLGRKFGINASGLAASNLHSETTSSKYYNLDILGNNASIDYIKQITSTPQCINGSTISDEENENRVNEDSDPDDASIIEEEENAASVDEEEMTESISEEEMAVQDLLPGNIQIENGSWVIIVWEKHWYVGKVEKIRNSNYLVNCLEYIPKKNGFKWPKIRDANWYPKNEILAFDLLPTMKKECYHIPTSCFSIFESLLH